MPLSRYAWLRNSERWISGRNNYLIKAHLQHTISNAIKIYTSLILKYILNLYIYIYILDHGNQDMPLFKWSSIKFIYIYVLISGVYSIYKPNHRNQDVYIIYALYIHYILTLYVYYTLYIVVLVKKDVLISTHFLCYFICRIFSFLQHCWGDFKRSLLKPPNNNSYYNLLKLPVATVIITSMILLYRGHIYQFWL